MSPNPFLALAEAQTVAPVKKQRARLAAKLEKRQAQAEQQQEEEGKLLKIYRAQKRAQRAALLDGPHGDAVKALVIFMHRMTLDEAPALMERIKGLPAMAKADRLTVLGLVGDAIVRVREKAGLDPYDDGLIGEPPKAFHQIKAQLGVA